MLDRMAAVLHIGPHEAEKPLSRLDGRGVGVRASGGDARLVSTNHHTSPRSQRTGRGVGVRVSRGTELRVDNPSTTPPPGFRLRPDNQFRRKR
jgi:hypothetical protein